LLSRSFHAMDANEYGHVTVDALGLVAKAEASEAFFESHRLAYHAVMTRTSSFLLKELERISQKTAVEF
jgi:hypothetical protein